MRYVADIDYGSGGRTEIPADGVSEALGDAVTWAAEGDWPGECEVTVRVMRIHDDGSTATYLDHDGYAETRATVG